MVNQQLVKYIFQQKEAGFSDDQIKQVLLQNGYNEADVNETFEYLENSQTAKPPVTQQPSAQQESSQSENTLSKGIKQRSPILVILLTIFTFSIYYIYWLVATSKELKKNTKNGPNPMLLLTLLFPPVGVFVLVYFIWKYCEGINELTGYNKLTLFILWLVFFPAAILIAQSELNKKADPNLSAKTEFIIFGIIGLLTIVSTVLFSVFFLKALTISGPGTDDYFEAGALNSDFETYQGDGFSIEYPESWTVGEISGIPYIGSERGTNVNFFVFPSSLAPETIQEVSDNVEAEMQESSMSSIKNKEMTTVARYDALKIELETESMGTTTEQLQYHVLTDDGYFIFTFTVMNDFTIESEVFQYMVDSIQFT